MVDQFLINKIVKEYQNKIYHLALGICRNESDAEDIVQNVFIRYYANCHF